MAERMCLLDMLRKSLNLRPFWRAARECRSRSGSTTLGNVAIDGEVEGKVWKIALELKTPKDDVFWVV